MTKIKIFEETTTLIQKDFDLLEQPTALTAEDLLAFLEEVVTHLLEHQMERLFQILYRLDIGEERVHQALHPDAKMLPAQALAQLIFEREQQKAQTRLLYQNTSAADETDEVAPW